MLGRPDSPKGWPTIMCRLEDWQVMMAYVNACEVEINGFGFVNYDPLDHVLWLHTPFILEQEASMAGVATKDDAWVAYLDEQVSSGRNTESICLQWHSHVWGVTQFSATDTANMARWPGDMLVSVVLNKRGDYCCRLDLYRPFAASVELPVQISMPGPNVAQLRDANVHIKQLVHKPPMLPQLTGAPRNGFPPSQPAPAEPSLWEQMFGAKPRDQRTSGVSDPSAVGSRRDRKKRWWQE